MKIADITKYVQTNLQVEKIPHNVVRQVKSTSVHITTYGVQIRIMDEMPRNPGGQNYACFYLGEWMDIAEIDKGINQAVAHYGMLRRKRALKRRRRKGS